MNLILNLIMNKRGSDPADPPSVRVGRMTEVQQIAKWILEAKNSNKK